MTTLKTLLLLALVCAVSAETDSSSGGSSNSLVVLANKAHELLNNFTNIWANGSSNSDAVTRALSDMSNMVAAGLAGVVKTMQTEVEAHSGQVSETMSAVSTSLNNTIAQLQSPENQRRVEDLRSNIQSGLQTMAQGATRVKDVVAENTEGVRRELHDVWGELLQAGQRLSEHVQEAIKEHQSSHDNQ